MLTRAKQLETAVHGCRILLILGLVPNEVAVVLSLLAASALLTLLVCLFLADSESFYIRTPAALVCGPLPLRGCLHGERIKDPSPRKILEGGSTFHLV